MMRVLKNKRGTTLVELVVCMVLLSLFTLAAVTLIQPSAQAYMQVQQQTRAQNLADALIETIDELGGIDIDVHDNEIDHLNNYQRSMFVENENDALNENIVKVTHSGMQTLSGLQATAYCRIRYVGDDFGRAERQRKVLMACMDKAKTMSPTTLVSILNKVMENVYTNLDVTEMASILSDVANYQIVAQDGVPFEDSRTTGTVGKKGSCVIPLDLETNVVKLHELLFDVTEYEPSDQVKQYSQKVQADTSQYIKK